MRLGDGDSSLSCGSMSFLKEVMDRRRAVEKAKNGGKDTTTSLTASPVSARNHSPSDNIDDMLIGVGCTGSGVSKAKDVSESESRRDGSVGPINNAKGRDFMEEYNTVDEQTPISADIEHFVHTISAFAVYLGISFFNIGYAMGAHAIHSTVTNVPEGLLLIGWTLTIKHKRVLTTNLDANADDKMGTLTPNNLMNGTASAAPMFCSVLFCPPPPQPSINSN